MAPQDINRKLKAKPFQPIRILVSDGATYDITEPTLAYMFVTELVIGIDLDEYGIPKRGVYIAPNHVTRIEPILSAAT